MLPQYIIICTITNQNNMIHLKPINNKEFNALLIYEIRLLVEYDLNFI